MAVSGVTQYAPGEGSYFVTAIEVGSQGGIFVLDAYKNDGTARFCGVLRNGGITWHQIY